MHVMIYRADRIQDELGLTRGGCILVGLMGGGDYHPVRSIFYTILPYLTFRIGRRPRLRSQNRTWSRPSRFR